MAPVWENVDDDWVYGPYRISNKGLENTRHPWVIYYKGRPLTQSHGIFEGRMRFAILENAKRRVGKLSVFSDCIIVGDYHPSLGEEGNIVFRNNNGSAMAITCKGRVFPSHYAVDLGVKLDNIGSEDRHRLINSLRFLMGLDLK